MRVVLRFLKPVGIEKLGDVVLDVREGSLVPKVGERFILEWRDGSSTLEVARRELHLFKKSTEPIPRYSDSTIDAERDRVDVWLTVKEID